MLDLNDFQNMVRLVRSRSPSSFEEGKVLVALEGKLIQVLEKHNDQLMQAKVDEAVAARATEEPTTKELHDIPSSP